VTCHVPELCLASGKKGQIYFKIYIYLLANLILYMKILLIKFRAPPGLLIQTCTLLHYLIVINPRYLRMMLNHQTSPSLSRRVWHQVETLRESFPQPSIPSRQHRAQWTHKLLWMRHLLCSPCCWLRDARSR